MVDNQKEIIIKEIVLKKLPIKRLRNKSLIKLTITNKLLNYLKLKFCSSFFIKIAKEAKNEENLKKSYDELVSQLKDKKDIRIRYIALKTQKEAGILYKIKVSKFICQKTKAKSIDKQVAKKVIGFVLEDALPKEIATS